MKRLFDGACRRLAGPPMVFAACLFAGQALADPPHSARDILIVGPLEQVSSDVLTARPRQGLLTQPVMAESAVRIEAPITFKYGMRTIHVESGTRLFGITSRGRPAYCAPAAAKSRAIWGTTVLCAEDADGDGAFELVRIGGSNNGHAHYVTFVDDRSLSDFILYDEETIFRPDKRRAKYQLNLIPPAPYTALQASEGPRAEVSIAWESDYKKTVKTGEPVRLALWRDADIHNSLGRAREKEETFELSRNGPTRLRFKGAEIEVLGFELDGSIHYRVITPLPEGRTEFAVSPQPFPGMMFIY